MPGLIMLQMFTPLAILLVSAVVVNAERVKLVNDLAQKSPQDGNIYWSIDLVATPMLSTCEAAAILTGEHYVGGSLEQIVSKPVCFKLGDRSPNLCESEDIVTRIPKEMFMQWDCQDNEAKVRVLPTGDYCDELCVPQSVYLFENETLSSADFIPLGKPCDSFGNANEVTEWMSLVDCSLGTSTEEAGTGPSTEGAVTDPSTEDAVTGSPSAGNAVTSTPTPDTNEPLNEQSWFQATLGIVGALAALVTIYESIKKRKRKDRSSQSPQTVELVVIQKNQSFS